MATRKPAARKRAVLNSDNPRQELKRALEELAELRTNKVIREALVQIVLDIDHQKLISQENTDTLKRIEVQVTRTNGRVTVLEMWRSKTTGVWAAIAAGAGFVGWLINQAIGFFHK